MSRSKKNWDHLVDEDGLYYDLLDTKGIKGKKGDTGATGLQGDQGDRGVKGYKGDTGPMGPVFIWKGPVPTESDLPFAFPGTNGHTYLVEDTNVLHVSNGNRTYSQITNIDVVKGDKGEVGGIGLTGQKGVKGDRGFGGDKGDDGEKGKQGDAGGQGIKGQKGVEGVIGVKGNKGDYEKGDKGQKGDDGTKGEKGDRDLPDATTGNLHLRKKGSWVRSEKYWPYQTATGINIQAVEGVGNENSNTNPHNHKFALNVSSTSGDPGNGTKSWSSFFIYKTNHNIFTRGTLFVKAYAEHATAGGTEVATKENLRSMRAALRAAVTEAVDFADLKAKLTTRLDSLEAELQDSDPAEVPNDPPST